MISLYFGCKKTKSLLHASVIHVTEILQPFSTSLLSIHKMYIENVFFLFAGEVTSSNFLIFR